MREQNPYQSEIGNDDEYEVETLRDRLTQQADIFDNIHDHPPWKPAAEFATASSSTIPRKISIARSPVDESDSCGWLEVPVVLSIPLS
jgi:hypothetical protein